MRAKAVRLVSLLLAAFFVFASHIAQDPSLLMGGLFFGLMAFLSMRNAGAIDGPYIYAAFSVGTLFYALASLSSGEFHWHGHRLSEQLSPREFWVVFTAMVLAGGGMLAYAYFRFRRRKKP